MVKLLVPIATTAGAAVAVVAARVAARHDDSALGGGGWVALSLQVATVAALAGVGADRFARPEGRTAAVLLLGAALSFGLAIAPPEFVGSDLWFTAALATAGTAPLLCVCAGLIWPRLARRSIRLVAVSIVAPAALGGMVPALLFDPSEAGCNSCAADLLSVTSAPDARSTMVRAALILVVVWNVAALAALAARGRWLPRAQRTIIWPVLAAGIAIAALSLASAAHQLALPVPEIDRTVQLLWDATCVAALGLGAAVAATSLVSRGAARTLTHQLLTATPSLDSLRRSFADLVGDPQLTVVLNPDSAARSAAVRVTRGDDLVAVIQFDPRFSDAVPRLADAARAAGLALEYAAARAALAREEAALRDSRRRVVRTGDAARYSAERDLHDGAQQRLIALSLQLVALRRGLDVTSQLAAVDEARAQLASATEELRGISHGLFPVTLRDDGLIAALRDYQTRSPIAIELRPGDVDSELDFDAAMAAYRLVVDAAGALRERAATVSVALDTNAARFEITLESTPVADVDELQHAVDRFRALDGDVTITAAADGCRIAGWVPCAS